MIKFLAFDFRSSVSIIFDHSCLQRGKYVAYVTSVLPVLRKNSVRGGTVIQNRHNVLLIDVGSFNE